MNIKRERLARGLSQAQLAREIGCSTQSIKRYEWSGKWAANPIPILKKALMDYFKNHPPIHKGDVI
jgi:ribosome-binding protein aMBF1 (putative translation factor)